MNSEASGLVQDGLAAQKRGDLRAATESFRKALSLAPGDLDAAVGLGGALLGSGDLAGTIQADRQALEHVSDDGRLRTNLGLALYREGNLDAAHLELERVHQEHPQDAQAAILLSYVYNKLGRFEESLELLSGFEAIRPTDPYLNYALGFAEIQTGKVEQGILRIERIAPARNTADVWMLAGRARFDQHQFRLASADAEAALRINPKFPGARTLAGQAHYAIGQLKEAAVDFQEALKLDSRDFTANLYLGILRLDDRDLESAEPLLELARSLAPNNPLARLELARLRNVKGDTNGALELLEDLERTEPEWLDPHVELAAVYFKLHRADDGRRERGIVEMLKANQTDPKTPR